ncbi:MAG: hypothetical protein GF341_02570 [candidate division Zixibacteria bacterium]|nr:hypothetical protein [candidate division Zixibacteria bacterium]
MRRRIALLAVLIITVGLWGCAQDDGMMSPTSTTAPTTESQTTVTPEFKAELEQMIESEEPLNTPMSASFGWNTIDGPAVITEPGIYAVTDDFAVADDGIVVQSDHVLLLLGNHCLTGPGNKEGRGIVLDGVKHVLVWGGQLKTLGLGVAVLNSEHCAVKGVSIEGGDEFADPGAGIAPQIGIMLINSPRNWIARNQMDLVNLGIFVRGSGSYKNHVFRNRVTGGDMGLLAICYNPAPGGGPDDGPSHDKIRFNHLERFPTGIQANTGVTNNYFTHNVIKYFVSPYEDLNGSNIFRHNRKMQITP